MTANNFVASKKHNCIWVATDAASYFGNGVVSEFRSKVRAIAEWPAVITGRGNSFGLDTATRELCSRAASFDEIISIVSRDLPLIVEQFKLRPFELTLAGFFKGQPMVFFIRTPGEHNSMGGDWPAYLVCPVGPTLFGPWPSDELIAASGFVEPDPDGEPEQITGGLRKLLELQRRTPAEDGFPRVGGFAELTVIRPDGIEQQILCRWPEDRIGHRMSTNWEH
ncbi:hypothetical protein [Bradyrhizobium ottawaense]|uniref:hypothetical protein n=1 Tax=Bradyrhizobium ottawaense TaxID=931866 RepID=UPI001BA79E83|nr:hypothetical protein [Bradyrhizobium ottawaense]MBR1362915.1 hypothetical protein [Bradyrhizobium ottawaense]GMO21763.1 hypothetical protein BwSF12_13050 [Bradyrhizobium ottawaense]GMO92877.1 hypothetical protein BwSF19_72680 [Bradyrhizobium ottawaense]